MHGTVPPVPKSLNAKTFKLIISWLLVYLTFSFRSVKNDMSKKREGWLVGVWDGKNEVPSIYH